MAFLDDADLYTIVIVVVVVVAVCMELLVDASSIVSIVAVKLLSLELVAMNVDEIFGDESLIDVVRSEVSLIVVSLRDVALVRVAFRTGVILETVAFKTGVLLETVVEVAKMVELIAASVTMASVLVIVEVEIMVVKRMLAVMIVETMFEVLVFFSEFTLAEGVAGLTDVFEISEPFTGMGYWSGVIIEVPAAAAVLVVADIFDCIDTSEPFTRMGYWGEVIIEVPAAAVRETLVVIAEILDDVMTAGEVGTNVDITIRETFRLHKSFSTSTIVPFRR